MKNLRNSVRLIGNLGADPKITKFGNQNQIASFNLATDDSYKDKNGKRVEQTQWHRIIVKGGLAFVAEKYLKKGMEIEVEGRLLTRSYETKDGEKRYITEIEANDLVMLGKKQSA
jgi:single-strand DNA-binding protein